jgi:predicted cobalt transporter CbtA
MHEEGERRKAAPLAVAKMVLSSFFGVRRRADHDAAMPQVTPVQLIVAGVVGAAIFVVCLVLLVKFIVSQAA